ncbi:MAG: sulfatase [Pirellulales bacterium]
MIRIFALFITAICLLPISSQSRGADQRPNVVLFLVDDMGIMDTSLPHLTDAAGKPQRYPLNDFYRTPNMEQLAARGIRFSHFYAMSVCSPTRVCLQTGQNAARHRTTNWINPDKDNAGPQGAPDWNWRGLDKRSTTLARVLQAGGYRTIHVGKGHFGPRGTEGEDPLNIGFDVNVGGCSIGQPASYYGKQNYGNAGGSVKKTAPHAVPGLEKYHGTDTFLSDALTAEAAAHISTAVKDGKPFYLNFAHYAVHAPFNSDPRFAANYQASGKPPQAQAFATLIEGMDKSLGDLMKFLEEIGQAENTLIFFLGDNGTDAPLGHEHAVACAAPLRGKKGSHYEGGMRVPFIAAWAKPNPENDLQKQFPVAIGSVQTQLAAVYDLFPTILNATKAEVPRDHVVDGQSLRQLLSGQADAGHRNDFLMHYPHGPHRSSYFTVYRQGPWKVIYHYVPTEQSANSHYQLFRLDRDPFEQEDLAAKEPIELKRMMQAMVDRLSVENAVYPMDTKTPQPLLPQVPK